MKMGSGNGSGEAGKGQITWGLEGHGAQCSRKTLDGLGRGALIYMLKRWLSELQENGLGLGGRSRDMEIKEERSRHQMLVAWVPMLAVGM